MTKTICEIFPMPKFVNEWNWSNVIALASIAIGGVVAFTNVKSDTVHLQQDVQAVKIQMEKVEAESAKQQLQSETRIINRLDQLQADIREIRAAQLRKGRE